MKRIGRIGTILGSLVGAACLVAVVLGSLWLSGHVRLFTRDRGLLQLLVAVPVGCLLASTLLAYYRLLRPSQMLWAMAPVAVLMLLAGGALTPTDAGWTWTVAVGAAVLLPWTGGVVLGGALTKRSNEQSRSSGRSL